MEDQKLCKYCLQLLSINLFQKNRARCNSCRSKQSTEWKRANIERFTKYQTLYKNKRYKEDLDFKIKAVLRSRLRKCLKNGWKSGSAVGLLGCSTQQFKNHLEKLWKPGMTWENWSKDGWHIDHIIPLDHFDLTKKEDLERACHYSNLQPLWCKENELKSNKVEL